MADISSINLNGNSYNIKDNNAVNKSGDTMTGTLDIKSISIDSSVTPSTTQFLTMVRGLDENDVTNSNIRMSYSNNGNETLQLVTHRVVNGVDKYNNFSIGLDASGNPIFYTDNQSEFCNAINAVKKSGDTMTGDLIISGENKTLRFVPADTSKMSYAQIYARNNERFAFWQRTSNGNGNELYLLPVINTSATGNNYYDILTTKNIDTTPTASSANPVTSGGVKTALDAKVSKSGDTMTGGLIVSSGDIEIQKGNINIGTSGNSNYKGITITGTGGFLAIRDTGIRFTFDQYLTGSTGGERFLLPNPESRSSDVWYSILTSKNPVTTAQGGTGGTDSGWQPYTNSNVFIGTIYYRKVGVFFEIQAQQINLKNTLAAGSSVLLMTVPSTYKPEKEIMPNCFINTGLVQNRVAPMRLAYNGQLYLYANKTDAIDSSYNLYFSGFGM